MPVSICGIFVSSKVKTVTDSSIHFLREFFLTFSDSETLFGHNNVPTKLAFVIEIAYYYPTAKKRYLPRIQKVTALISEVPQAIANGDWAAVEEFAATCDNAVLPLQLYVSSLDGQGLSMANSYAKAMKNDAKIFESNFKDLQKALKKKDKELALKSVQEMGVAVADYRQAGRLTDSDGNIPSVEEIRRSTMRRSTQAGFALAQQ